MKTYNITIRQSSTLFSNLLITKLTTFFLPLEAGTELTIPEKGGFTKFSKTFEVFFRSIDLTEVLLDLFAGP